MTRTIARIVAAFALVTAIFILGVSIALAHSWYPWECCHDRDCHIVKAEGVKVDRSGYTLADGTFIPHSHARPSPDGEYHVCRYQDGKGAMITTNKGPCFWAPVGGS